MFICVGRPNIYDHDSGNKIKVLYSVLVHPVNDHIIYRIILIEEIKCKPYKHAILSYHKGFPGLKN